MWEIALLIIAIAFAVLTVFVILLLRKISDTVDESRQSLKVLTSDVNVTLYQTNELLAKANVLVEDVNGKVETIDPLFTAIADLSESVSDLNQQARYFGQKASNATSNVGKAGAAYTVGKVASKLFKKKGK
ncbi:DUF948 domain-containing protein [Streptococcus devriesei]|uniref:DUF948 domain-containing protein n=1 Tax=Streptococcus devriesei TaxID=231233 RepID=UPI00041EE98C|nr:DUF948 domain-containing protein [Streptococcus devriesei]